MGVIKKIQYFFEGGGSYRYKFKSHYFTTPYHLKKRSNVLILYIYIYKDYLNHNIRSTYKHIHPSSLFLITIFVLKHHKEMVEIVFIP